MGYPWVQDMQDTGYTGYRIWDTLGKGYAGYRIYRIQNMGYPFTIVTVEVNISI